MASYTGKIETSGSIFSPETEAQGVHATLEKSISIPVVFKA